MPIEHDVSESASESESGAASESQGIAGASGPDYIAQLRAVSHQYQGQVQALTDINFRLTQGSLTVLIGANGSGKSTLLAILAASLTPTHGHVEILGHRLPLSSGRSGRVALRQLRSRLACVSQVLALDPEMTGQETLSFLATLQGVPRRVRSERVAELAKTFGLQPLLPRLAKTYSGGQSRRLHVAAGLLADPELLLLDEPSAGLDAEGSGLLWHELVQRSQRGRTVVLVTHDLLQAQAHADRVVLMHAGKCIADDTPQALSAGIRIPAASPSSDQASSQEPALARVYRELTGQVVEASVEASRATQANKTPGSGRGRGQWQPQTQ